MQPKAPRRSNAERTHAMRAHLVAKARALFAERGYAETSTPDVVAAAEVTRGALYHHFEDKKALFRAVVESEAAEVAERIDASSAASSSRSRSSAIAALLAGARAYLRAMAVPGRTRLLLLDGPAVLGRTEMDALDAKHAARTLRAGLDASMREGAIKKIPLDALTGLLSAAFDRAAIAIAEGAPPASYEKALAALLDGLAPGSAE